MKRVLGSNKDLLRNNMAFSKPNHHAWLRCNSMKYIDIPALLRLAKRAPRLRKYRVISERTLTMDAESCSSADSP